MKGAMNRTGGVIAKSSPPPPIDPLLFCTEWNCFCFIEL